MPPEYVDDARSEDHAVLWRYISPRHIKPDGTVSSTAYKTIHLSVYVVGDAPGDGITTPEAVRAKFPAGSRFQCFTAGMARAAGCIVARVPDDKGDESHRDVCPSDNPHSQLRQEAYRLRDIATWVDGDEPPS